MGHPAQAAGGGLQHVSLYWPYPTRISPASGCRFPRGLSLVGISRANCPGDGTIRNVAAIVVAWLSQFALWLGLLPHLGAMAYKGEGYALDSFGLAHDQWAPTAVALIGGSLSLVVLTVGSRALNKVVCMVFAGVDAAPKWVLKMSRVPEDAPTLLTEVDVLSRLHSAKVGLETKLVLPQTLAFGEANGVSMSLQTHLGGVPLHKQVTQDTYGHFARQLTDSQISLAKLSSNRTVILTSKKVEQLLALMGNLPSQWPNAQALSQTREVLSDLREVPGVCVHNDFGPWNLISTHDGLGSIDWADAEWDGMPLLDLVYGLATLAFAAEKSVASWGMLGGLPKARRCENPARVCLSRGTKPLCARGWSAGQPDSHPPPPDLGSSQSLEPSGEQVGCGREPIPVVREHVRSDMGNGAGDSNG